MKYLEYMHEGWVEMKRVESDYIPILGGHLVIKEASGSIVSGDLTKKDGVLHTGKSLRVTKKELLDLKKCIDKALSNFDSFQE